MLNLCCHFHLPFIYPSSVIFGYFPRSILFVPILASPLQHCLSVDLHNTKSLNIINRQDTLWILKELFLSRSFRMLSSACFETLSYINVRDWFSIIYPSHSYVRQTGAFSLQRKCSLQTWGTFGKVPTNSCFRICMQYLNHILCAFCEHLISYICQRYRKWMK